MCMLMGVPPGHESFFLKLIAETYLMENKIKEARWWLNKVFSKKPDYPRALYNLGVIVQ